LHDLLPHEHNDEFKRVNALLLELENEAREHGKKFAFRGGEVVLIEIEEN
jgi:hypothetical protein